MYGLLSTTGQADALSHPMTITYLKPRSEKTHKKEKTTKQISRVLSK